MVKNEPDNNSSEKNPVGRFMVAVGAVMELGESGKILLLKRSADLDWHPGEWEIPYGRLDQFESCEQGLRREIKEEVGIDEFEIVKILTTWHIYRGQTKSAENDLIGITFHCRTDHKEVRLSEEHSESAWKLPKKALEMVKVEGIKRDIQAFINKK